MPHRYWRLLMNAGPNSPFTLAEMQFRTSPYVPLLFSGGTISTSSNYNTGTNPASNVADNNINTWWGAATNNPGEWWAYDYGAGNAPDIVQITVTARNDTFFGQAPTNFSLQYSDNNTTWTNLQTFAAATWNNQGQTQTFSAFPSGLIWSDGFDSYTVGSNPPAPWIGAANATVQTGQAHSTPNSLGLGVSGLSATPYLPFYENLAQYYVDFWMFTTTASGANQGLAFQSTTASINTNCPTLAVQSTGAGQCGVNWGGTWFTFSVTTGAWHHYRYEITQAAAGSCKLTVDGTVVGTYSGDTRDTSGNAFTQAVFIDAPTIGPSPPAEFYVDDFSVYAGTVTTGGSGGATQAYALVMA